MDKHTYHYVTTNIENEPFMNFLSSIGCCENIDKYVSNNLVYKINPMGIAYAEMGLHEFKKNIDPLVLKRITPWYKKEENIKWVIERLLNVKTAIGVSIIYLSLNAVNILGVAYKFFR